MVHFRWARKRSDDMQGLFDFIQMLSVIVHLRYSLAGLTVGAIAGIIYKRLVYGSSVSGTSLGSNPGDDVVIIVTVVCALIGMVLDIRRGLKNR
jgi:hypothetical protein